MDEIKELDDKYLVLKLEDIKNLDTKCQIRLEGIVGLIDIKRHRAGKKDNKYLVLNLNDDINIQQLCNHICVIADDAFMKNQAVKVKDIAVDIVNAILKAKEKQ